MIIDFSGDRAHPDPGSDRQRLAALGGCLDAADQVGGGSGLCVTGDSIGAIVGAILARRPGCGVPVGKIPAPHGQAAF
jgi:hypothetical protein